VSVEASWQGFRVGLLMNNLFLGGNEKSRHPQKSKRKCDRGGYFFFSGKVTPHAKFNILFNAEAEKTQYLIAEMILLKRAKVRVETKSELTGGQISIDSRPVPKTGANARVALQVYQGKFFTSFVEDLKQLFTTAELS
jgi:inosine-uridine nucleoside N-ribohydrolase